MPSSFHLQEIIYPSQNLVPSSKNYARGEGEYRMYWLQICGFPFLQLGSVVVQSQSTPAGYLSNWLGRLCQIRHIKAHCLSELRSSHQHGDTEPNQTSTIPDFTQFA